MTTLRQRQSRDGRTGLRRRSRAASMGVAVVLALIGAASVAPQGTASAAASSPTKALTIKFVSTYNGLSFYVATYCGIRAAAHAQGGKINVSEVGPPTGMDVSEQLPILQSIIAARPDGFILVPSDPRALIPTLEHARALGIPFTTTDTTLVKRLDLANYVTDNIAGGKLAGQQMLRLLRGAKGPVLVIDIKTGLPVTNERAAGFISVVKAAGVSVLPVQYNQNEPAQATTIVQAVLQAHPNLAGIFATAEAASVGAISALHGAKTNVHIIAYDTSPVEVRSLKNGQVDALIGQGSYAEGYGAMTTLVRYLRGQLKLNAITYRQVAPLQLVTQANVNKPKVVSEFEYPSSCPSM